jgi:hypothetical protein
MRPSEKQQDMSVNWARASAQMSQAYENEIRTSVPHHAAVPMERSGCLKLALVATCLVLRQSDVRPT